MQQHEEAFESFDKAVDLQANDAIAWLNRGLSLIELERHEDALASFDKATRFRPDSAKAWDNRGLALGQVRPRRKTPSKASTRPFAIDPDLPGPTITRPSVTPCSGSFDIALEALQQAVRLDPDYKEEARTEPAFDELWSDNWFRELVGKIGGNLSLDSQFLSPGIDVSRPTFVDIKAILFKERHYVFIGSTGLDYCRNYCGVLQKHLSRPSRGGWVAH